jgi:hypothetical protein
MEPTHIRFGGGAADTMLSPQVAVLMLIGIVLILVLPRRKVIAAYLPLCLCIPLGEVVVLGGIHFTVLRILIMVGMVRAIIAPGSASEGRFSGGFNRIDRVTALWTALTFVSFVLEWMNPQALIWSLGVLVDMLGGYLVLRFLIPDGETMRLAVKVLALICVVQGAEMVGEQIIHQNLFGYLVIGAPSAVEVREGAIRSSGTMGCLYNGVFAGALTPLFVWLWTEKRDRLVAYAGLAGALAMVITSHESTPLMAVGAGILALALWPIRGRMRMVRWGIVFILVGLQLVMKAPVWALIARVDLIGGSSGYHRYMLVNNCIVHFGEWWLMGYKGYNLWGPFMWDMCNQYVAVAVTGGLATLACYIGIFKRAFGAVGTARKSVAGHRSQEWLFWCLGAALFATAVGYFGTSTSAQSVIGWLCLLACISTATFEARPPVARSVSEPGHEPAAFAIAGALSGPRPVSRPSHPGMTAVEMWRANRQDRY